jgi:DNA repair exonuclease SbcCD nuclease subunit
VHLGDVFDRRKYVNFNTLADWRSQVFDKLASYNKPVHIVVGNHDTFYKTTNKINSVEQLLSKYNWFIYTEPTTIKLDQLDVCIVPWICDGNLQSSMNEIDTTKAQVCFGHLELMGFDLFPGHTNLDKGFDAKLFNKFDLVFSGHFHHKSNKNNIYYLGSPYPMTWSDWGDQRGFHIFDTETRELEFIENPYQIFHKLYYNDTLPLEKNDFLNLTGMFVKVIVQKKTNPYAFDQFIESLQKVNPYDISIVESSFEDSNQEDDEIDQAKDTLTILMEYVDDLGIEEGKDNLKQVLRDLYIESLNYTDASQ